jgi:hypothetical protein
MKTASPLSFALCLLGRKIPNSKMSFCSRCYDFSEAVDFPEARTKSSMADEPTYEELKAKLAALEGSRREGSLQFKVGEKGGVSVYGLGRFPVTLYYEQWMRLIDALPTLKEFLETNKSRLKLKEPH